MALTRPRFRQLDTSVVSTTDPITVLNQGASSANVDVGFLFNRANGLVPNVALYWSESSQSIVTAYTNGNGSINSNITVSSYANLKVGNVVVSGIFYSNGAPFSSFSTSDVATYLPTDPTIISLQANAGAQANQIAGANAAIVTANTALKSYVDAQDAAITSAWTANAASLSGQIAGANAAIVTANTALKSYVDTQDATITSSITTAWQANAASQDASINAINANVGSFYVYANATYSTISNAGSLQSQINGANAAIVTANTALKSYVDTQDAAITTAWTANAASQQGQITTLQGQVYTNANVNSYLYSSGAGNIVISNGAHNLALHGPGATTVGSSTAIPVITTDAYGRIASLSTAAVSSTLNIAGGTGTGTVSLTNQTLTIASGTGITTSAAGQTITVTNSGVTGLSSSGIGNLTVSASTGSITVSLPATGPGVTTVGSSTSIPVITTDAYGRISALSSSSVSTTINLAGTTGTGSVSGGGTLTFASTNGISASVSGSTVTVNSPQDLRTTASPVFNNGTYFGNVDVQGTLTVANLQARGTMNIVAQDPMLYLQANILYPWNFDTGIFSDSIGGPANTYVHHGVVRSYVNNYWGFFSNVKPEPDATVDWSAAGLMWDTIKAGDIISANTTAASSTTTGALRVAGGAGIAGSLYAGSVYDNGSRVISSVTVTAGTGMSGGGTITGASGTVTLTNAGVTSLVAGGNIGISSSTGAVTVSATNAGVTGAFAGSGIGVSSATGGVTITNNGVIGISAGSGITANASTGVVSITNSGVTSIAGTTNQISASASTGAVTLSLPSTVNLTTLNAVTIGNVGANVVGTGTYLTSLNASNLSTGTVPLAQLSGITNTQLSASAGITNGQLANSSITVTAGSGLSGGGTVSLGGSITITNAGVTSITAGTGITANVSTGAISITNSGVTGLSSSGAGNLTVSASTGSITVALPATGPGATTVGSSTSIPVITTDAYGRISALSSQSVSTTINLAGTSGTGSVSGGGTLTFASTNGITATASGSTITVSSPQDVRTSASPTFAGGNFTGNVTRNSRAIVTNYSGNVAPASPVMGDEWFRGNTGIMYKYLYDNVSNTYNWINISSALYNTSTGAVANTLALRDSGANITASNFIGVASQAKYADLAEIYSSDENYEPSTVVVFGGMQEITATGKSHDTRVAGVISTNPAYLMNSESTGLPVAFTGRVPCKVYGPISKGDLLVTSEHKGYAERMCDTLYKPGCILGKALGDVEENIFTTIEVVVGRF